MSIDQSHVDAFHRFASQQVASGGAESLQGLLDEWRTFHKTPDERTPLELLRLPRSERAKLLEASAAKAVHEYRTNQQLTDFEAFDKDDFYVEDT